MTPPDEGLNPFEADKSFDAAAWTALKAARHGAAIPARLRGHPLCRLLRPVATPAPLVFAQLGQSLDGRIATVSGASHYINGPVAIDHLHRLRALADAVLVGVGTVCADDCQLTVRRVEGPSPARVVIDPSGRMAQTARMLADDGVRRIVIRAEGVQPCAVPGVETIHLALDQGRLAPRDVVAALARRGLRRVLVEGGAHTVSSFVAADLVDRLHVMVAPLLVGSGRPGLTLAPVDRLELARRPLTTAHPLGRDVLFDCDLRSSAEEAPDRGAAATLPKGETDERDDHDARRRQLHHDG